MPKDLLVVEDLSVTFPLKGGLLGRARGQIQAVSGVNFTVAEGETLGLVGESGSGKSTTARAILGLERIAGGDIRFDGRSLRGLNAAEWREVRRDIQMVFQDPYASLHPRMTALQAITEAWRLNPDVVPRSKWRARGQELLEQVGLNPDHGDRFPNQFSGGQRQRIGIARALALRPRLIVFDEPVSALDVSIQAQILNLLAGLQHEINLTSLFIAHDLSVVHHVSTRVAVMYLGKVMEAGPRTDIYRRPAHPYTQALLSSVPSMAPSPDARPHHRHLLAGDIPSPADPPSGCRFRTRCWKAQDVCAEREPAPAEAILQVACHFPEVEHRAS